MVLRVLIKSLPKFAVKHIGSINIKLFIALHLSLLLDIIWLISAQKERTDWLPAFLVIRDSFQLDRDEE